ncbi:MAG TPA: protein kinase, partial [Chloroflexota bacterium]|nr:protein kinase [Chloroflexota bacterium]
DLAVAFPDGARFVPLAPVADPTMVASTVARVLDVREVGGEPLTKRLVAFVGDKRLLLVLDNFEHVVGAAPLVTGLLTACPGLKVLVTSRGRLRVSGEREFPVPPLALPALADLPAVEEVARSEAVRLFTERARAAKPDFALTVLC